MEREIQLGEPPTLLGYGPALSAIRPAKLSAFLFSAATGGTSARLRQVDLDNRSVSRGGTIRGSLRDVWQDGNDLWVLATQRCIASPPRISRSKRPSRFRLTC